MIDGPGPPLTTRITGVPSCLVPVMRCARIRSEAPGPVGETCDTQRILLLWLAAGGELSVPNGIAAIRPDAPTS